MKMNAWEQSTLIEIFGLDFQARLECATEDVYTYCTKRRVLKVPYLKMPYDLDAHDFAHSFKEYETNVRTNQHQADVEYFQKTHSLALRKHYTNK